MSQSYAEDTISIDPLRPAAASRRAVVSQMGAALLVTVAAASPARCAAPDGDLIAACQAYVTQWSAKRAEWDDADEEGRRKIAALAASDMINARASDDLMWRAAVEISRMPAHTPEGIRAKARVAQCWLRDCGAEHEPRFSADAGVATAWSLVADVLGRA